MIGVIYTLVRKLRNSALNERRKQYGYECFCIVYTVFYVHLSCLDQVVVYTVFYTCQDIKLHVLLFNIK